MAMTTAGMRALRAAATLADIVPVVRIRVRDGERTVCTVSRTAPEEWEEVPSLPPCAFRRGVGHAYRQHRQGIRLCFLDVAADGEPAIDVGLRPGDVTLPGQIYRIATHDEKFLFVFMTELDAVAAQRAMHDALDAAVRCDGAPHGSPPPDGKGMRRIGLHADEVTELTAVHTICPADDAEQAARTMTRLLEVCVAAEAIAELETTTHSGGPT